jgi:RNA recognition motif-containing protein
MSAKVVMNPNAVEAKCFGLVTMSQESEAETAIQKLNGYKLHNKEIVTSRVSVSIHIYRLLLVNPSQKNENSISVPNHMILYYTQLQCLLVYFQMY